MLSVTSNMISEGSLPAAATMHAAVSTSPGWLSCSGDRLMAMRIGGSPRFRQPALSPALDLPAGLADHPLADAADLPAAPGHRDELHRRRRTKLRVCPARQRLGADDRPAAAVVLGLEVQRQAAILIAVSRPRWVASARSAVAACWCRRCCSRCGRTAWPCTWPRRYARSAPPRPRRPAENAPRRCWASRTAKVPSITNVSCITCCTRSTMPCADSGARMRSSTTTNSSPPTRATLSQRSGPVSRS